MLTNEQIEAAKAGIEVPLVEDGVDLILVRRDVLERIKAARADEGWTDEEMRMVAARTFQDADTAGPIE
jgi:hypothetical protein